MNHKDNSAYVIILMGSASDLSHCNEIKAALDRLGIPCIQRIASAHKTPQRLLDILAEYESEGRPRVYITVAGRSNALSGMVDAMATAPVIACPPYSQNFGGADLYSSLRMPGGVAPMVVLEPGNAALAAAKIIGLVDGAVQGKIRELQDANAQTLADADAKLNE